MRKKAWLALGVLLTLGLIGCGSNKDNGGVATAGGKSAGPGSVASGKEAGLKYSQCMRDNGVPEFPDPDVDDTGRVTYDIPENIPDAQINAAEAKCKDLRPFGPGPGGPDPARIEQLRKHSQCIRDNGIPEFPDPEADGSRRIDFAKIGLSGPDDPKFKAALEKCQKMMPSPPGPR
jgi:hypothetical protein